MHQLPADAAAPEAWDAAYRSRGLVIVGVHTPEFAFEHVASNVRDAVKRLGVKYPVVQDNEFGTWNAYSNQYWPAEYLIDRNGHVRHVHFGEGAYDETEGADPQAARRGRRARDEAFAEHDADGLHDARVVPRLRAARPLRGHAGEARRGRARTPSRRRSAAERARLRRQVARRGRADRRGRRRGCACTSRRSDVYLVLGGKGDVDVLVDGRPTRTVNVDGYRLYTLRASSHAPRHAARAALHARRAGVRVHVRLARGRVAAGTRVTVLSRA